MDSKGFVPDEAFVTTPLPASEKAYADIDGRHLKSFISEVTAIIDQVNKLSRAELQPKAPSTAAR